MDSNIDKQAIREELKRRNDLKREWFKQRMIRLFGDFYAEHEFKKWLRANHGQTKEQI